MRQHYRKPSSGAKAIAIDQREITRRYRLMLLWSVLASAGTSLSLFFLRLLLGF
ncbi:hypothetical protein [Thermosporothrix hazakensis]|uniref:hypothetical protein n=1 Tax=Thermosporothrix hazakensis TaxID=644383 RepID=UPI001472A713|nr:hypothetical protein [Thermosporothrix hazakensis]